MLAAGVGRVWRTHGHPVEEEQPERRDDDAEEHDREADLCEVDEGDVVARALRNAGHADVGARADQRAHPSEASAESQ